MSWKEVLLITFHITFLTKTGILAIAWLPRIRRLYTVGLRWFWQTHFQALVLRAASGWSLFEDGGNAPELETKWFLKTCVVLLIYCREQLNYTIWNSAAYETLEFPQCNLLIGKLHSKYDFLLICVCSKLNVSRLSFRWCARKELCDLQQCRNRTVCYCRMVRSCKIGCSCILGSKTCLELWPGYGLSFLMQWLPVPWANSWIFNCFLSDSKNQESKLRILKVVSFMVSYL